MKYFMAFLFITLFCGNAVAQIRQNYQPENYEQKVENVMRYKSRSTSNMKEARNLLIVKQVADFKYGDEKLAANYEDLETDKQFERDMNKIMAQLENKKMRNSKNREVIRILNEAGNKLYNLLAN